MIGAVAPWFGAKRILASDIVAEIGRCASYWEPFCGSCAVLFAKPPQGDETVNDLHGHLTHVLRCLCHEKTAQKIYGMLSRVVVSEGLWGQAVKSLECDPPDEYERDPALAADWLVASWLSRNGLGGTENWKTSFAVCHTSQGGGPVRRWQHVVESIPEWHQRLRNVCVLQRDALAVIARIRDERGTVIYCDPPYLAKSVPYTHDLDDNRHAKLAELLRRFKRARVLVSYYADPKLAELYPGWTVRELDLTKTLGQRDNDMASDTIVKAPEVLLINGPSYVEAPSLWPQ